MRSSDSADNKSLTTNNTSSVTVYSTLTLTLPVTTLGGYYNVIQVGTSAFQDIPITDLTIPTSITSIMPNAFTGLGFVSPTIGGSISPMVIVNAATTVSELKNWISTYGINFSGANNMPVIFSTGNGIMFETIDGTEYIFTFIDRTVNSNVRIGTGLNTGAANGIGESTATLPLALNLPNAFREGLYPIVQIGPRAFYQISVRKGAVREASDEKRWG